MERKTYKFEDLTVGQLVQWNQSLDSSIGKVLEVNKTSARIEWNQFRENPTIKIERKSKKNVFYEVTEESIRVIKEEVLGTRLKRNFNGLIDNLCDILNFESISTLDHILAIEKIQEKMNETLNEYKEQLRKI